MIISKITSKGQTTIPKQIRNALNLQANDRIVYEIRKKDVILHAIRGTILEYKNSVNPRNQPEDFKKIRSEIKKNSRDQ